MRLSLQCHPDMPGQAVSGVSVSPNLRGDKFVELIFRIKGDVSTMVWPERCTSERTDGLWQTTCFEMFLQSGDGPAYVEYNFSPSSRWAAYEFGCYREGMQLFNLPHPPNIEAEAASESGICEIRISVESPEPIDGANCGFSAVVEEKDGRKSYWALAHPSRQPDFHHRDCFVHKLRAT